MFLVHLEFSDIVVLLLGLGLLALISVSALCDWVCSKFKRRDRDENS